MEHRSEGPQVTNDLFAGLLNLFQSLLRRIPGSICGTLRTVFPLLQDCESKMPALTFGSAPYCSLVQKTINSFCFADCGMPIGTPTWKPPPTSRCKTYSHHEEMKEVGQQLQMENVPAWLKLTAISDEMYVNIKLVLKQKQLNPNNGTIEAWHN